MLNGSLGWVRFLVQGPVYIDTQLSQKMIEKIERHTSEAAELVLLGASLQCSIFATLLVFLVVLALVAAGIVSVSVYFVQKKHADEESLVTTAPINEVAGRPVPTRLSAEALHEDMVMTPHQGLILALRRRHNGGSTLADDADGGATQTGGTSASATGEMSRDGVQNVQ